MNPFDTPPSGEPVTWVPPRPAADQPFEQPSPPGRPGRGGGRMALVAVLTAGFVAGGIVGVGALVAADRPETASPTTTVAPDGPVPTTTTATPTTPPTTVAETRDGVLPIDELSELLDDGALGRAMECLGLPAIDWPAELDDTPAGDLPYGDPAALEAELEALLDGLGLDGVWADGGTFENGGGVTVSGPDGISVVDLGDGGSVTVRNDGGDITIETAGDATVTALDDLVAELGSIFDDEGLVGWLNDERVQELLDRLPDPEQLGDSVPVAPDRVQTCLDDLVGG